MVGKENYSGKKKMRIGNRRRGEKRGKFFIDTRIAWDSSITRDKLFADRFQIMEKKKTS